MNLGIMRTALVAWLAGGMIVSTLAGDSGPELAIRFEDDAGARMAVVGFDRSEGRETFFQESPDLSGWRYLDRFWTAGGGGVEISLPMETAPRFFRVATFTEPVHEWVTAEAQTELAGYRIFHSAALGRPTSYHVSLPPAYASDDEREFPVLYWLHGSGAGILGVGPVSRFLRNAMDAGLIPQMILVFPNGLPNGMWCDSKDGSTPIESILMEDLIPHVDRTYRTLATRDGRLIEGFSMGGYGAGRLGLKHAEHFRGFSMFGAGPMQLDFLTTESVIVPLPKRQEIFEEVYGGDMDYYESLHPWRLAEQHADGLPDDFRIRVMVGTEDLMLANNRLFHAHLNDLEIRHEYRELEGIGHQPLQSLMAVGSGNWAFYREIFGGAE